MANVANAAAAGAGGGAAGAGGGRGAAVAPQYPPGPILSFRQLFSLAREDPYNGDYSGVMTAFEAPVTAPLRGWSATGKLTQAVRMGAGVCNAYVGLFTGSCRANWTISCRSCSYRPCPS